MKLIGTPIIVLMMINMIIIDTSRTVFNPLIHRERSKEQHPCRQEKSIAILITTPDFLALLMMHPWIRLMLLLLMMITPTLSRAPERREHLWRAPPGPRKVLLDAYWGGQQMAVASLEDATAPGRPKTPQEVRNLRGSILALPQPWRNVVSNDPD